MIFDQFKKGEVALNLGDLAEASTQISPQVLAVLENTKVPKSIRNGIRVQVPGDAIPTPTPKPQQGEGSGSKPEGKDKNTR